MLHKMELPTWLLLHKVDLYFLSQLLNILDIEFPHLKNRNNNCFMGCYKN